jgi:ABC-type branched-subunit amino acid transport system permease subunit
LGQVGADQFNYTTSLSALLILAIYGLSSVPGAIIGAVFFVVLYQLLPVWISSTTVVEGLQPFLIALGVLNLVVHPEGVVAQNGASSPPPWPDAGPAGPLISPRRCRRGSGAH